MTTLTLTLLHLAKSTRRTAAFAMSRRSPRPSSSAARDNGQYLYYHPSSSTLRLTSSTSAVKTSSETQLVQDMLYRIRECNNMPEEIKASLVNFQVDGVILGKVRPKMAELLCSVAPSGKGSEVFEMANPSSSSMKPYMTLSTRSAGTTVESRTQAVASVMDELRNEGIVTGWRDELFPVSDSFYNPPLFLIERAAVTTMGILEYGVHINGILKPDTPSSSRTSSTVVKDPPPLMWMARRSKTKSKHPGMLDHIVAGGQPAGLSLMENVIKECEEEAGIPPEIARSNIHATGVISYESFEPKRDKVSRVVLFNYDLYLPKDFVPKPVDGEVEEFFLWSIDQLKESMARDFPDPIKPNCYVVIIEYLLRMGYISPETPGYLDIVRELRSGDCQ
eukprot:CAMPEP_0178817062 /NCGR_PEP_ID=MMETSP0746-20121128/1686_1 /TAXON_ID=913974 /ORGANISM="Nitzschia punctata, Strain CCMP561" /LENGTH=391 /DNA_ID=CAMNT_0020478131 /DNA_START=148 /DNA_END=1323 /DNA_ORIENTATION=+